MIFFKIIQEIFFQKFISKICPKILNDKRKKTKKLLKYRK